jgi:hypothetical protein
MLTALISAAIIGGLALLGVKLSLAQVAGVAIAVKILVVSGIFGIAAKYYRKKPVDAPVPGVESVEQEKI